MPSTAAEPDSRPPVFLTDPAALAADTVVLDGPEGRHAATVRRLAVGERADLIDGAGLVAECVVTAAGAGRLELNVVARRSEPRPDPALVVAQALPKGDHGPLAVDLMTEGGVDVIVPWAARRCVTRWEGARGERALARWRGPSRQTVPPGLAAGGDQPGQHRRTRGAGGHGRPGGAARPGRARGAERNGPSGQRRDPRDRRPGRRCQPGGDRTAHPGG